MPATGEEKRALLEQMSAFRADDADWHHGRTWSLVYHIDDEHSEFLKRAHGLFASTNGLNPMAFKSLKRMEADVVSMTADMLNGDGGVVGTMTSGGTESILLAVQAYRDRARRGRPWIRRPNMVVPATIHVAFDKAAHYFGVRIRRVPVGPDHRADVDAMRRRINRNTIFLAASAPQYPHGVVDPIAELGALARQKKLPLHVDACIGGFMLPWVEALGRHVPTFDFRVPGVTSISADAHKYGYAAKGASVILYRDMSYLKHQFFVESNWCGGIYASPSMPGTRPGGSIAAAWAALRTIGRDGYIRLAERAMECVDRLRAGIDAIDGVAVLGDPHSTLIAYASTTPAVDIFVVADLLEAKGWNIDRQQFPDSIHCTVNGNNLAVVDGYLADLAGAVAHARAHPELKSSGNAAMYGMMAKIPVRAMVRSSVRKVMEQMYAPGGGTPDLSNVGSGADDDWTLRLMNRYGDRVMSLLGRFDNWKKRRH
jgi:glutamate/tyrosine decarboxylase-like PLP-dependent enzyme